MTASVETRKDARQRSTRTFWQGMISTVVVAAIFAVVEFISIADINTDTVFVHETYIGLIAAVSVAVLTTAASYIQRRIEGDK